MLASPVKAAVVHVTDLGLLLLETSVYFGPSGAAPLSNVKYAGTITMSSAVPEPGTWAMMLLGFGRLGFARTRRSRTVGAAA